MNTSDSPAVTRKTAGIIVVGDEILRGQTVDTNSHVLCQTLYKLNIPVQTIVIVPDNVALIANEVRSFCTLYDYVLTTGGIGPTHDDVTYEAVSKAFNVSLVRHPILVKLIEEFFEGRDGEDSGRDHPAYKMSAVPENARVLFARDRTDHRFPLISVENVFMFPGIPYYLERCLPVLVEYLKPYSSNPPDFRSIYLGLDEVSITDAIDGAVAQFRERVRFGSYPNVSNNYYKVRITMESDEKGIDEAEAYLQNVFPQGAIVQYDSDPITNAGKLLYDRVAKEPEGALAHCVRMLEDCLNNRYKPSEICISFNGGKDCTALLHLYHAVLQHQQQHSNTIEKGRIIAFYVKCWDPFPEVESFVKETVTRYNLDLFEVPGPIKDGLVQLLTAKPNIKAILMGNRRTDPHSSHLRPHQETDPSWPEVIRVFPLLDWCYRDIWQYLRQSYIPYCMLYDKGYTSLGSRFNTAPNPNLKYIKDGIAAYRPAYKLDDPRMERNGRS